MWGESACRPGSVRPLARGGGHPSGTAVAGSLVRSTREHRAGRPQSLAQGAAGSPLDLAPGGVYRAAAVTCGAGGLLHHRFTLTPADAGAVCFLWHCPAGHPGSALPTTLPCGARTFLTGLAPGATARPTHPCSGYAGCHRARVPNRRRRRLAADSSSPNPWAGLDESSPSAVRVAPDRSGEGAEGAWPDRAVLRVTAEGVAVAHVAELPEAQAAHSCLSEVREEMPGALRREHAPRARVEVAVRVQLARAGVRHELDLGISMATDGGRLQLQER